jgi:hypothetical protein
MASNAGLPPDMDCDLIGIDKKEGTTPMHVIPFSNKVFAYIISSTLFFVIFTIVYLSLKKINTGSTEKIKKFISYASIFILIGSFVLFCLGDGNHPYELCFGMIGIIISCIVMFYFFDWEHIVPIGNAILNLILDGFGLILKFLNYILIRFKNCIKDSECRGTIQLLFVGFVVFSLIGWIIYKTVTQ